MSRVSYSICIRTLGTAGEKYARTLASIKAQIIQPEEVVIVIPHGYELPKERLGYERFVRCDKGMVRQRVVGFNEMKSEYTLALDDDLSFEPDFAERLIELSASQDADFVNPKIIDIASPVSAFGGGNPLIHNILRWMIGVNWSSRTNRGYATRIAPTGGFVSRTSIDINMIYPAQSGHGAVCFGKTAALKALNFEDEMWLEGAGYALPDDQVMFYKLFLLGNKLIYAPSVAVTHLDAGTSITSDRKLKNIFASARNNMIFWHRFILKPRRNKIIPILAYSRRVAMSLILSFAKGVLHRDFTVLKTYISGYKSGLRFLRSSEYHTLPII